MSTQAQEFVARFSDATSLMTALDAEIGDGDQDWENENTKWTLDDGSKVVVSGADYHAE